MKVSAIYLVVRAASGILGLLLIGLLARVLTPEDYGTYSLVLTSATLLSTITFQWLREGLLRQMPALSDIKSKDNLIATIFWLWLVLSAIMLLPTSIISTSVDGTTYAFVMAALASMIAFHGLNLDRARSQLQTKGYAILWLSRAFLAVALPFVGSLFVELNAIIILGTTALSFLAPSITVLPLWLRSLRTAPSWPLARSLFSYGLPFAVALMGEHALQVIGRALLATHSDQAQVGLYAAALDTVWMSFMMVALAASAGHIPRVIAAYSAGDVVRSRTLLASLMTLVGLLLAPALTILILYPTDLAQLLLGHEMGVATASTIPWIAIAATVYAQKLIFFDTALKLTKRGSSQFTILLFTLGTFVLVAWVLVPARGAEGASQALAIAATVATLMTWWAASRHYQLAWPTRDAFKLAASLGVSVGVTLIFTSGGASLFIRILIFAASYIGAVISLDVHTIRTLVILPAIGRLFRRG